MSACAPERLLQRIRAEYLEMPGLRLTVQQIQRLCGAEPVPCQLVLDSLVAAKFLCRKPNGAYARLTDGQIPRPGATKADLKPHNSERQQPSPVSGRAQAR
jgi:hypothetical protein